MVAASSSSIEYSAACVFLGCDFCIRPRGLYRYALGCNLHHCDAGVVCLVERWEQTLAAGLLFFSGRGHAGQRPNSALLGWVDCPPAGRGSLGLANACADLVVAGHALVCCGCDALVFAGAAAQSAIL